MSTNSKQRNDFLTIVIPCFNEAKNITILLEKLNELLTANNLVEEIKILIINNGSTDNTKEVIDKEIDKYSFARSLQIKKNQGYGYGILEGLKHSSSEFIGWTHGDLQTELKDILKAADLIKKYNYSSKLFIKGQRKGRPIFDQFFSDCMSIIESLLFLMPLYEINAQPTIFHRSLYSHCNKPPIDFSIDLYFYVKAILLNYKIERINVNFLRRIYGSSKWNINIKSKIRFISRTLTYSIKLSQRLRNEKSC